MQEESHVYDVIVIGSGGGGLSAAARLAAKGKKVLVMEQHHNVGGYMTSFQREGYQFEVSLHTMDQSGIDALSRLGVKHKAKEIKLDPPYRGVYPDFTIDIPADVDKYRERLKELFPQEAKGIDKLFHDLGIIHQGAGCLLDLQRGGRNIFKAIWQMITQPSIPWLLWKYWNSSCQDMLNNYIHDEKLVSVFSQLCLSYIGTSNARASGMLFALMWVSYHFGGFYYFEGGSQAISNALAEFVKSNGGQILLDTLATKIVIQNNKAVAVQTRDGKEFKCRHVVSNVNALDTAFKLVGKDNLPDKYIKSIEEMTISPLPIFAVYLGVNHDFSNDFPPGVHSLIVMPLYNNEEAFKICREGTPDKLGFALTNYTIVDPTNAPEGKNVIAITTFMPYDYKRDWDEGVGQEERQALKQQVAQIFIKKAEEFLPGLSDHIEVMEVGTPRTMERYTLNPMGSILGWEFTKEQSLFKRLPQKTPIQNLYLAGAWTNPGGGQSAVMVSGLQAAKLILSRSG